jgi:hypothetical protein
MTTNGTPIRSVQDHPYLNADGAQVIKRRTNYTDGSKSFKWPIGTKMEDILPFGSEDLKRLQPGEPLLILEGENTVDAVARHGFIALCMPGGSSQKNFGRLRQVLEPYSDHAVFVSPDNDKPGNKHMELLFEHLKEYHPEVRWIPPVVEAPGGDFADLLAPYREDHDKARELVLAAIATAIEGPPGPTPAEVPEKQRVTIYTAAQLAEMELPPVREVIPGLYGVGHYLLSGAPKMGKSFLAMSLATALGSGTYALGKIKVDKHPVLYLSLEDGLRRTVTRLQHRLRDMAELPQIDFAFSWPNLEEGGLELLERWMRGHSEGVVFVDTGKRLRQGSEDTGRSFYESDYDFIAPLTDLVHDVDTMMLTLWHDRKMGAEDFFDQVNSSRGLTAAVDGVSQLQRDRGSKVAKLSIGDRDTEDRAFKLQWDDVLLGWLLVEKIDVAQEKQSGAALVLSTIRKLQSADMGVSSDMVAVETGLPKGSVKNHFMTLRTQGVIRDVRRGFVHTVDDEEEGGE